MRWLWLGPMLLGASIAFGQTGDVAKQVYAASQESVFLVYLNDSSGTPSALGSAFLIAPHLLVTNAHVVRAGSPVLAVGPVRIPLKVIKTDQKNDLAILSVDADLTSRPLTLALGTVSPGEQIFAIGNPEGLEKSISQGIVSGLRNREDRALIQITSPISHGSSGGPVLNIKGEVVAVAVGMLEDGQNLNFAVPVEYVRSLMAQKSEEAKEPADLASRLEQLKTLFEKRLKADYSSDPSSDYQQETAPLLDLMGSIVKGSSDEGQLTAVTCLGADSFDLSDSSLDAARKLVRVKPSSEGHALLAYALFKRAQTEELNAEFAAKGSDEQTKAEAVHRQFLAEASREAAETAKVAKGNSLLVASFVLGNTKNDLGEYGAAITLHSLVANGKPKICGDELAAQAIRDLIDENINAKHPEEAEEWFGRLASLYEPLPYEWDAEGDRRVAARDYAAAGTAYEKAAEKGTYLGYDYCWAVIELSALPDGDADRILSDGRSCVDSSVKSTQKQNEEQFGKTLPGVYSDMAEVLERRGVYSSALEYIKESLTARPDNPFSLNIEAEILEDLQRYSECISASQAAIRASDGKYPSMQFQLGQCYFDTENWTQAAASYRLAADGNKNDAASAYNLALSLARQGFTTDANGWFREALNRNPSSELRAKILKALQ